MDLKEHLENKKKNKDYRDHSVVEMHDNDDLVTRFYKIGARNEGQLNMLEKLFVYIEYLSRVGASRAVTVYVDGDGALGLKFSSHQKDEFVFKKLDYDTVMDKDSGYGRADIGKDDMDSWFDLG